jgi:protein-disulfide isomerase
MAPISFAGLKYHGMHRNSLALALSACLAVAALAAVATMRADDIAATIDRPESPATTSPVIRPLSKDDHFVGNPNATVTFVVYNDFECPYCKLFHPTALSLVDAIGQDGGASVVYRHFPNDRRHERAQDAAVASECVAELGGSEKFFSYAEILYANSPDSLSEESLQAAAAGLGIDPDAFTACRVGEAAKARVARDYQDGLELAKNDPAFGTPYIVALSHDGRQVTISGNASRADLIQVARVLSLPPEAAAE